MRYFILILIYTFSVQVSTQEKLINSDEKTIEITNAYNKELVLTNKQIPLFKKVIADYLDARENVQRKYKGQTELNELYKLQKAELNDMSNILTEKQLRRYIAVRNRIEPLKKIK